MPKNLYDGYCTDCFYKNHPEDQRTRNHKIRELAVVNRVIDRVGTAYPTHADKQHGPSRKRPDLLIELVAFNIIVEVDENQHSQYDPEDERERIQLIHRDLKHKPLIVIRINPDTYKKNGKSQGSAFRVNKESKLVEPIPKKFDERMERLYERVDYHIATGTTSAEPIVEYLFYNE